MPVSVSGLTKRYGQTLALDGVSLEIPDGSVHALLGHNGAGKSTLIKCLGGGTSPTAGTMSVDGLTVESFTPRESIHAGIAVIYQHLSLIGRLSVSENLFLGHERRSAAMFVDSATQNRLARQALASVGAESIDPRMPVGLLPIGQRQLVEIAKAMQRNARLLILDEPTAALSKTESARLGELVKELREQGIAILYVTHLLSEVLKLADQASVLRNGRNVWSATRAALTKDALVEAISDGHGAENEPPAPPREDHPVLELDGFGSPGIGPFDLSVRPGEIVALHGLIGSGRTRLLNTLFGRHPADRGQVRLNGTVLKINSPKQALAAGIALVPGDRAAEGLFGTMPALDNVVTRVMGNLSVAGFRSRPRERKVFRETAGSLDLKPMRPDIAAGSFSGGNQQKILLGRWMNGEANTRVLLLDDPTQGVDVGARKDIYDAVKKLARDRGIGVIVATNEPEEVIDLAHRCLLMRNGRVEEEYLVSNTTADELLTAVHAEAGTSSTANNPTTSESEDNANV